MKSFEVLSGHWKGSSRGLGEVNPCFELTKVSRSLIVMDPSMDTVPHLSLDCEQSEDGVVSLAERRSSFAHDCSTSDSSIIHI